MITLVNILFILTPFLLPIFVYLQHKVTVTITSNQDQNAEQKPYTLAQLCVDVGKLLINGPMWIVITFVILSKSQEKPFISYVEMCMGTTFLILVLAACISYYCIKTERNSTSKNVAILVLIVLNNFSIALAVLWILRIMDHFCGLGLYASGI